ncbi:MAG: TIR domain-containing protein [Clostridia bacterium]|nr:TIR domain-containing protein [Clostridia bacterium]
MAVFKCKMCGGNLIPNPDGKTATCDSCDSISTLPNDRDERIVSMHNRANDLRMNSEFDRAISVYEKVIAEDDKDAEAYWGLLLCKYGIEYVTDPATGKYVPTCHRAKYGSILNDADFLEVLKRADPDARARYQAQAQEINTIMQEILTIAAKQEKYDVFISYKEQDNGVRTMDSFRARSLYDKLMAKGIRTFYAPESLPLGKNYEPIIFSALHSARVMVLMGSKPEYFTAVWVKNEWARYLELINQGEEKTLIPAYWDLIPEMDLPREVMGLQAVNMGTPVGELQLIEYVEKLVRSQKTGSMAAPTAAAAPAGSTIRQEAQALLKRADIFLDNGQFDEATSYYNRVLDKDPENARAYWGQLMCRRKCRTADELIRYGKPIDREIAYKNAVRFAPAELKQTYVAVHKAIEERVTSVCKALDAELCRRINGEDFKQKAEEIQKGLEARSPQNASQRQILQQQSRGLQQLLSQMKEAMAALQAQVGQAEQQYNQAVNYFHQEKDPAKAASRISELNRLRQMVQGAYSTLVNQCDRSQQASALRTQCSQCRQADHNAQLLVSEYKQRRSEIAQIRSQIQNLEKQCMNLKNQVRQGEYSDAWKFLGRRL